MTMTVCLRSCHMSYAHQTAINPAISSATTMATAPTSFNLSDCAISDGNLPTAETVPETRSDPAGCTVHAKIRLRVPLSKHFATE
jgi:hypothetical protein